jgi:DNA-binding beta-propeller fold protein YncE
MRILSGGGCPALIVAILSLALFLSMGNGQAAAAGSADPAALSKSVAAGGTGQAASSTDAGTAIPVLDCPIGIAVNKSDELFVANHWASNTFCGEPGQILIFDNNGVQLTDRTIKAGLGNPAAIAFDKAENIYVTVYDQQLVRVYDPAGKPLPAKFLKTDPNYNPSGVQIDSRGDVWVANRNNNNITIGEVEIFHKSGGVDKITEGLVYPLGIIFQARTLNGWIANAETPSGDSFTILSEDGRFLDTISTSNFTPCYLALNAKSGRLYATDAVNTSEVGIFDASGKQIGTPITTGLNLPYGIAFDSAGDFFVANLGNSTITKYSSSGKLLCTITQSGCK